MKHLQLNLQQGVIFHSEDPNLVNAICAFYNRHRTILMIRAGFQSMETEIMNYAIEHILDNNGRQTIWDIYYGDAFSIDTWDKRLELILSKKQMEEELNSHRSNG